MSYSHLGIVYRIAKKERCRPIGPAHDEVADVIEDIVEAYLALRATPEELFVDTVKRLGVEPFRERVYATR